MFEMTVISEYVSEYCIWLALRDGLQQLVRDGQLPFSIVDLNTTGIVVSGRLIHGVLYNSRQTGCPGVVV